MNTTKLSLVQRENLRIWREGVRFGFRRFAAWHDGVETVGVLKRPLKNALKDVDDGKYDVMSGIG